MDSWVDILLPGAAILALFGVVGLVIQVIRLGRALRRLEERSILGGGSATDVSLKRLQELQARMSGKEPPPDRPVRPGPGGGRKAAPAVVAVVILGLLGGGGWYFFLRDDGGGSAIAESTTDSTTEGTTSTATPPPGPTAVAQGRVPANPKPLVNKASYTVAVLNASGVTGAARNVVAPKVTLAGYILGPVDDAQLQDPSKSVVMWAKGKRNIAWNVAKDLSIERATPLDGISADGLQDVDAVVVVGLDLAQG
jgi:LytR cell envelope-related transcriptional attenuator